MGQIYQKNKHGHDLYRETKISLVVPSDIGTMDATDLWVLHFALLHIYVIHI